MQYLKSTMNTTIAKLWILIGQEYFVGYKLYMWEQVSKLESQ